MLAWLSPNPRPPRSGLAYVGVRVVVYALALLLIVVIYSTKERALLVAPAIAVLCGAATWYLLGDTSLSPRRRLAVSAGVALILAELTWALGYWSTLPLVGGAALWLAVYVLSGTLEADASGSLDRRIALEYTVVAVVGTAFILLVSRPWSP
ncbi:MAG TPA: hypothetical protein VFG86_01910 [Chloroflexota bacterium]|nr:hypothetical protein [Chloroflexota bacterium]